MPLPPTSAERGLRRHVWDLTWPIVITNGLEVLVALVDLLLVRPFGPDATAAIGVSRQLAIVVDALAGAITVGALALVSRAVGAGSRRQVEAIIRQSVRLVVFLGVPIAAAGYLFSRQVLTGLQASPATTAWGEPYLRVFFVGLVFSWGNLAGAAICRGAGDVWTPLKLTLAVGTLNVALSYVLIYGIGPFPRLEVVGAAVAFVIARFCGVCGYLMVHKRWRAAKAGPLADAPTAPPEPASVCWPILRIGAPMALANVLRHGSRLVFLAIVGSSSLGVSLQAAVSIGMQVRLLGLVVALAFQTSTATLVGQAIGRNDVPAAEQVARRSVQLLGALMLVLLGTIFVLADPLAALLIASDEGAHLTAVVLRWFAVAQMFSSLSIGIQGALMGAGDTVPALRYTLLSEWGVMIPLAYLFLQTDWWFPESLLAAWTVAPIITFAFMARCWRSGRWKQVAGTAR